MEFPFFIPPDAILVRAEWINGKGWLACITRKMSLRSEAGVARRPTLDGAIFAAYQDAEEQYNNHNTLVDRANEARQAEASKISELTLADLDL